MDNVDHNNVGVGQYSREVRRPEPYGHHPYHQQPTYAQQYYQQPQQYPQYGGYGYGGDDSTDYGYQDPGAQVDSYAAEMGHVGYDEQRRPIYRARDGRHYHQNGAAAYAPTRPVSAAAAYGHQQAHDYRVAQKVQQAGVDLGRRAGLFGAPDGGPPPPPPPPGMPAAPAVTIVNTPPAPMAASSFFGGFVQKMSLPNPAAGALISAVGAAVGAYAGTRYVPMIPRLPHALQNPVVAAGAGAAIGAGLAGALALLLANKTAHKQHAEQTGAPIP